MPRHVFFSFHYERDIFRANVVRNSWRGRGVTCAGFVDRSMWEDAKATHPSALRRRIRQGLTGTSVTVVLIGSETWRRDWVRFEIEESWARNNGLFGIRIHGIRCRKTFAVGRWGRNPFNFVSVSTDSGRRVNLGRIVPVYDWTRDDGYHNLGSWVNVAAEDVGR